MGDNVGPYSAAAGRIIQAENAKAEIDAAWQYIQNGYDIETRAELEAAAKTNGFKYGLVQAIHHIWKRRPKVVELQARFDETWAAWNRENELRRDAEEARDTLQACVKTLLENNDGPTGGDSYFGESDTHVLVRIEDFKALEVAEKTIEIERGEALALLAGANDERPASLIDGIKLLELNCNAEHERAEKAEAERDTLQADLDRYRAGDFTAEEIHGFCHKLAETVPREEFERGCREYQATLYGPPAPAPHAEIECPVCGVMVRQVASTTLSLALWQHFNWVHNGGKEP